MTYFFVYGTLKRGQANERVWPHQPRQILRAILSGARLYDLGAYPAMTEGDPEHQVLGEVWSFDDDDAAGQQIVAEVTARLDRLEGYAPGHRGNLYDRKAVMVDALGIDDQPFAHLEAWAYFYARPLNGVQMTSADGQPVEWKGRVR